MNRKYFLVAGLAVALIIAIAAPMIASSNPDGLEGAFYGIFGAKEMQGASIDGNRAAAAEEEVLARTGNDFSYRSPFPDYSIGGLGKYDESAALVIGTLLIIGIAYGLTRFVRRAE